MSSKALLAFAALASFLPMLCNAAPDLSKSPVKFCTKSPCPAKNCPVSITTKDAVAPNCKIYNTKTVIGGHGFKGAAGGGHSIYADIAQPKFGCETIIRSPAAVDKPGCGVVVGDFHQATCAALVLHNTFMVQKKCGGSKMIRGMDWKRDSGLSGVTLTFENGTIIEPVEVGEPPEELEARDAMTLEARDADPSEDGPVYLLDPPMLEDRDADPSETDAAFEGHINKLMVRQKAKNCKHWKPKNGMKDYTKSASHTQIVATNVDGGKQGGSIQISKARTVSQSISMTAGVNLEIVTAETTITFTKSITDTKAFTFNIPAGETGNVGFTPILRCSTGTCGPSGSHGTVCTGFHQGGAIAGTYAVIAES